jgi:SAM-dependent methyltransferase
VTDAPDPKAIVRAGYDRASRAYRGDEATGELPPLVFVVGDMTEVRFPASAFDAVVALYSLIHVPVGEQPPLLARIHDWLRPGGPLLATVGVDAWTGSEDDWLGSGATMWWSHADEETYLGWLDAAGFDLIERTFVPEGTTGHVFVLAERR